MVPNVVFGGYSVKDAIIATPHEDDVDVAEVLGMNILENFEIGLNFLTSEFYLKKRSDFVSQKPKYQSGAVSLMQHHFAERHNL